MAEEAKIENAEDSALGAYAMYGTLKRLEIRMSILTIEAKIDVQDTVKCLAKGVGPLGFKKKGSATYKKAKTKKQNRRTTSADDD